MTRTTTEPAHASRRTLLVLTAVVACAACGGGNAGGGQVEGGSTGGLARSGTDRTPGEPIQPPAGDDGGTMSFTLDRGVSLSLPVTFCAGFGTVLTVVAREGETQVDLRIVENPAMRNGMPVESGTVGSFRHAGSDDGRRFEELWSSERILQVLRDGPRTHVRGTMTGQRFYAIDEVRLAPGVPVEGGLEAGFSIEATCGG